MKDCPSDIPVIVTDGNHDIGNTAFMKHAWMGYEKQFGQLWYHFIVSKHKFFFIIKRILIVKLVQIGNRCFIVIDTQVYVLADEEALKMRAKQNDWLMSIFESLAADMKVTIFTHTPLFVESVDEIKAVEGKVSFSG